MSKDIKFKIDSNKKSFIGNKCIRSVLFHQMYLTKIKYFDFDK